MGEANVPAKNLDCNVGVGSNVGKEPSDGPHPTATCATYGVRQLVGDDLQGIAAVLFGGILGFLPGAGLVALVWLLGIYALILGVTLIVLCGATPGQT